jgi:hypothetical protein
MFRGKKSKMGFAQKRSHIFVVEKVVGGNSLVECAALGESLSCLNRQQLGK